MKILYIEWACFGDKDIKDAFVAEGHDYVCFDLPAGRNFRNDDKTESDFLSALHNEVPDAVFSFGYYPIISKVCNKENIRYVSWIYDNPYIMLYSYTVLNPCNVIYVFDKELYSEFHNAGIKTVHYMHLAVNTERLSTMGCSPYSSMPYAYDISFVGSLYTEENNFFDQMTTLSDYTKGYLDALMAAQMKVQGYNFIQESLNPVMDDLYKAFPMEPNKDGLETEEYFYAQYVVNRKITALERSDLLSAVSRIHTLDLFTRDEGYTLPNVRNHGIVDYYEAPKVYRQSRINLNITLRSIKSGIPLRAFDIMGSGSFLLSNFQADFLDIFIPGEDFVYYESRDDLLRKIIYYLEHEEERQAIACNGYQKVAAAHTFRHRVREMFDF